MGGSLGDYVIAYTLPTPTRKNNKPPKPPFRKCKKNENVKKLECFACLLFLPLRPSRPSGAGRKKKTMAKLGKALQTMARGRVGSIVYYVRKGEQVARSLSQSTTNPQTSAQMTTRVTWNNLVQFFKRSSFWMHWGAFESKKNTWSDYNAFMSANAKKLDVAITKEQAAAGYAVVADYVVTKGSLPTVNLTYSDNKFVSDIYFGSDADFESDVTVGELSQMLLDNNNGLQAGDQLSFIVYVQSGNADAPTMTCRAFEMIIDIEDTTLFNDIVGDFLNVSYSGANGALTMQFTGQGGATIIVSREVSGKLKVSSQTLVLDTAQQTFLAQFTTPEARRRAARSYGSDGVRNFLSAGYSNAGSEDAPIALAILSVNGVMAGREINYPNGATFSILMSREIVGSITGAYAHVAGGINDDVQLQYQQHTEGTAAYSFLGDTSAELIGKPIDSVRIEIGDESVVINYTLPNDDNQEGIGG